MNNSKMASFKISILYFVLLIITFVLTIYIAIAVDQNGCFDYMWILPLGHMLAVYFAPNLFNNLFHNFVRLLLIAGYTVRNVLTPLLITLGGHRVNTIYYFDSISITKAALLMAFETIVVFCFANYYVKQQEMNDKELGGNKFEYVHERVFKSNTLFNIVIIFLTFFMVLAYVMVPSISDAYQNLWTADTEIITQKFSTINQYDAGSGSRLFYAFFLMFFSFMQIIWSIYLIKAIRKLLGNNYISVFLAFGVLLINTLFVSETSAYTLFVLVLLFMYLLTLYPEKKSIITKVALFGISVVVFIMVMARVASPNSGNANVISNFASLFNAYFPGIINVSVIWRVETPSELVTLYFDIYSGIPLTSIIQPLFSNGERLSRYFNYAAGTTSQIIPFIGQTYFYFSFLGPLVQCFFIYLALKWEHESFYERNYIKYMALITGGVLYALGCTMYDLTILCAFTLKTIIPFFILGWLTDIGVRYNK